MKYFNHHLGLVLKLYIRFRALIGDILYEGDGMIVYRPLNLCPCLGRNKSPMPNDFQWVGCLRPVRNNAVSFVVYSLLVFSLLGTTLFGVECSLVVSHADVSCASLIGYAVFCWMIFEHRNQVSSALYGCVQRFCVSVIPGVIHMLSFRSPRREIFWANDRIPDHGCRGW